MHTNNLVLPKLSGADELSWDVAQTYSNSNLKYKKITDYVTAVSSNYKAIRNIQINISTNAELSKYTWLGTRDSDHSNNSFSIYPGGLVYYYNTNNAFGVRAAK